MHGMHGARDARGAARKCKKHTPHKAGGIRRDAKMSRVNEEEGKRTRQARLSGIR